MTTDDEIERIARRMIETTLPKSEWNHRAHFASALWLLSHPDELVQAGSIETLIRRYNEATGVPNTENSGFHKTITEASLRGAIAYLDDAKGESLSIVLDRLMASDLGRSSWPLAHWTESLLMSAEARRCWVEPDLAPLPWPPLANEAISA